MTHFRDERGRFVSASPKVRAGLEAMRPKPDDVQWIPIPDMKYGEHRIANPVQPVRIWANGKQIYCDAIYRPERNGRDVSHTWYGRLILRYVRWVLTPPAKP